MPLEITSPDYPDIPELPELPELPEKNKFPMPDEYFMKKALDEAKEAFGRDEVPVGAVVVCKDRIIARAHNLV